MWLSTFKLEFVDMSPETNNCKTQVAIAAWKWKNLFNNENGIKLNISKYPKLNSKIYPIEAKSSGSYQTSVLSMAYSNKKGFIMCNPSIKVEKKKQGDETKIYILTDRDTQEKFMFAVKSMPLPIGIVG